MAQNGHSLGENRRGFPEEAATADTVISARPRIIESFRNLFRKETEGLERSADFFETEVTCDTNFGLYDCVVECNHQISSYTASSHLRASSSADANMELFEKIVVLNQRLSDVQPLLEQSTALTDERIRACDARLGMLEEVKASTRLQRYDALDIGTRLMKIEQAHLERRLKQLTQLLQIEQRERYQNLELLRTLRTN